MRAYQSQMIPTQPVTAPTTMNAMGQPTCVIRWPNSRGVSAMPHWLQKRLPARFSAPQEGQRGGNGAPQLEQKRLPGRLGWPQVGQLTLGGSIVSPSYHHPCLTDHPGGTTLEPEHDGGDASGSSASIGRIIYL